MCYVDGYIWKVRLGGQTDLKPPEFGENLRALSEASVNPPNMKTDQARDQEG